MTTFGERLRRLRQSQGLSQKELAGADLTSGYVSLLETGKRSPSTEVVQLLARRLGCSSTRLLTGEPSERDQRIALEQAYARLAVEHGESDEARHRIEQLLSEEDIADHDRDELTLLLGRACERSGDLVSAARVLEGPFARALRAETHIPVTFLAITLMRCYLDSGDLHHAASIGESALTAAETQRLAGTDDYFRLAATVMDAYLGLGDYLKARLWADRYLTRAVEEGQPAGQAALFWNAAVLAEREGRLAEALTLCERALGLLTELGTVRDTARLQLDMVWLLLLDDPPQTGRATNILDRCGDVLADLGSRVDRARWNWLWAIVLLQQGDDAGAEDRARDAVSLIANGGPLEQVQAQVTLSDVLAVQGRRDEAAEPLLTAFSRLAQAGPRGRTAALSWRDIGERLADVGQVPEAIQAFQRALDAAGVYARRYNLLSRLDELAANVMQTPPRRS